MSAGQRVKSTDDLIRYRRALRDNRTLRWDTKLALFCLAERYPDIRPGYTLLAEDTSMSRRQVMRAVAGALTAGWLAETHHGKATKDASRYALCFPTSDYQTPVTDSTSDCQTPELVTDRHPKESRRTQENRASPPDGDVSARGKHWSAEEDENLKRLADADMPIENISAELQRSPGAIRSRLAKMGMGAVAKPNPRAEERAKHQRLEDARERAHLFKPGDEEYLRTQLPTIPPPDDPDYAVEIAALAQLFEREPADIAALVEAYREPEPDHAPAPAPARVQAEPDFRTGLGFERRSDGVAFILADAEYDMGSGEYLWQRETLDGERLADVSTSCLTGWLKSGVIKEVAVPARPWVPPADDGYISPNDLVNLAKS